MVGSLLMVQREPQASWKSGSRLSRYYGWQTDMSACNGGGGGGNPGKISTNWRNKDNYRILTPTIKINLICSNLHTQNSRAIRKIVLASPSPHSGINPGITHALIHRPISLCGVRQGPHADGRSSSDFPAAWVRDSLALPSHNYLMSNGIT